MSKRNRKHTRIIWLAYFVRYGYWAMVLLIAPALATMHVPKIIGRSILFSMAAIFGAYHLIGLRFKFRHLYCAMQEAYHEVMTPTKFILFTDQMRRDILIIGWLFLILGIMGLIALFT